MSLIDAANHYRAAGLCVLPAKRLEKRPAVGSWKRYQERLPTDHEITTWFTPGTSSPDALCLLCGEVSGYLEMIDFDAGGELFSAWWDKLPESLRDKLVVEVTPSSGYHVAYRCASPICGNLKLAQRKVNDKLQTLIETRGEGGLFLCAPTPGYLLGHGSFEHLPVLSDEERDTLLQAAWDLNEYVPPVVDGPQSARVGHVSRSVEAGTTDRPGDDFNARGDVRDVLAQHGWVCVHTGVNEYWRRPGKETGSWSATLKQLDGVPVFYVFSANAEPFESNRAYSPFAVYALLNHGGDFEQAARSLRISGYGSDIGHTLPDVDVDISAVVEQAGEGVTVNDEPSTQAPEIPDPGPMPVEMLRLPGFVGEVMDHCLATAPYPNQVMAFCGALSLQAFLAGRKVRDSGDNRTNLYLLGLAHSASGKDWPRKINTRILNEIGQADALGERFASGEGIQDALFQTPSMLFQTDEIDGMLQSINKAKDARHEAIMSTLLTMYSSSNSVFPMRRKAGKESAGVIDQPCLVIFGTAIPNHYYEALSERMLTNGFFARMIILEAGARGAGQEPSIADLPERVLESAKWWANYRPPGGNLRDEHPVPAIVTHTDEAKSRLIEVREEAEAEYAKAESRSDPVGTTVWGRVSEQTRKLALLYAISENHQSPHIGIDAVQWASRFVMHQTRRMLFMAAGHVAENEFHAECLKVIQKLRKAPERELAHSVLLKRMKMDSKSFGTLIETLVQQGDLECIIQPRAGSSVRTYRLVQGVNPEREISQGGEM